MGEKIIYTVYIYTYICNAENLTKIGNAILGEPQNNPLKFRFKLK